MYPGEVSFSPPPQSFLFQPSPIDNQQTDALRDNAPSHRCTTAHSSPGASAVVQAQARTNPHARRRTVSSSYPEHFYDPRGLLAGPCMPAVIRSIARM